jgi:hypothetical protein
MAVTVIRANDLFENLSLSRSSWYINRHRGNPAVAASQTLCEASVTALGRFSPRRQSEQKYCEGQKSRQYIQSTRGLNKWCVCTGAFSLRGQVRLRQRGAGGGGGRDGRAGAGAPGGLHGPRVPPCQVTRPARLARPASCDPSDPAQTAGPAQLI